MLDLCDAIHVRKYSSMFILSPIVIPHSGFSKEHGVQAPARGEEHGADEERSGAGPAGDQDAGHDAREPGAGEHSDGGAEAAGEASGVTSRLVSEYTLLANGYSL